MKTYCTIAVVLICFMLGSAQASGQNGLRIAYINQYTNQHDSLPPGQQNKKREAVFVEQMLRSFFNQLSSQLPAVRLDLQSFDNQQSPELQDSIYRIIAADSTYILVIDNSWSLQLQAAAPLIDSLHIPVIAMSGLQNNVKFGSSVLFLNNGNNTPYLLSAFIAKALKRNNVILISETDVPLHRRFVNALYNYDISITKSFELDSKLGAMDADSLSFFNEIQAFANENMALFRSTPILLNTHHPWGNKIIEYAESQWDSTLLIASSIATNLKLDGWLGDTTHNQLIMLSAPEANVSRRVYQQSIDFASQFPEFDDLAQPNLIKLCVDAFDIARQAILSLGGQQSREGIADFFAKLSNNTLETEYELYYFDEERNLNEEPDFTLFKAGSFAAFPYQLNSRRKVVPYLRFGMDLQSIYDIDFSANSFAADFYYWVIADAANMRYEKNIFFENMKQGDSDVQLMTEKQSGGLQYKLYKASAKFFVDFDLSAFPFDEQELTLTARITAPEDRLKVSFARESFDQRNFEKLHINSWYIKAFYATVDNIISRNLRGDIESVEGQTNKFKSISYRINIERKFWVPFLQVILPLIFITLIAIALLFVNDLTFANLGEVSVGTFLSVIAFSIGLSEIIPQSDQQTKADLFFLLTFVTVTLCFLIIIFMNSVYKETELKKMSLKPWGLRIFIIYILGFTLLMIW